jgi:hypothetical protein
LGVIKNMTKIRYKFVFLPDNEEIIVHSDNVESAAILAAGDRIAYDKSPEIGVIYHSYGGGWAVLCNSPRKLRLVDPYAGEKFV